MLVTRERQKFEHVMRHTSQAFRKANTFSTIIKVTGWLLNPEKYTEISRKNIVMEHKNQNDYKWEEITVPGEKS